MEMGSTYSNLMIEVLMHIHALTNMHRASGNEEYRKSAVAWLPRLESNLKSLREELTKEAK